MDYESYTTKVAEARASLLERLETVRVYSEVMSPINGIPESALNALAQSLNEVKGLNDAWPGDNVLCTMTEKVAAYEKFFTSDDNTLIVVGMDGGGEGKTAALHRVDEHPETIVFSESTPRSMPATSRFRQSNKKIIYDLYSSDELLIGELALKYNARIIRFTRGTEA